VPISVTGVYQDTSAERAKLPPTGLPAQNW